MRADDVHGGAAAALDFLLDNCRAFGERRYNREAAAPRQLAWAPRGAPPGGAGCALAVAFTDGCLILFSPPSTRAAAWDEAQDLTAELVARFQSAGWQARRMRALACVHALTQHACAGRGAC